MKKEKTRPEVKMSFTKEEYIVLLKAASTPQYLRKEKKS
jgi:hypothetical protein